MDKYVLLIGCFAFILREYTIRAEKYSGDEPSCDKKINHYYDLGCEPRFDNSADRCPSRFDCAKVFSLSKNQCHFQGVGYDAGERIPNNRTESRCYAGCTCKIDSTGLRFWCDDLQCSEYTVPVHSGCMLLYDWDKCCSTGTICPQELENLRACHYEQRTYYENQLRTDENCEHCRCDRSGNWTCKRLQCPGTSLFHYIKAREFCAPVYAPNSKCCPTHWICPNGREIVSSVDREAFVSSYQHNKACRFGDSRVAIGQKVQRGEGKEACECVVPPLLTCTRNPVVNRV